MEVSGESAAAWLQGLYDEHKESAELKVLPVQATIDKAKADEKKLRMLVADVASWSLPCVVQEKETIVRAAVQTFDDSSGHLRDYADHIELVAEREGKEQSKRKKDWRNSRDYLKILLEKKSVPRAVAKCASAVAQAFASDPVVAGVEYLKYSLEFSVQPDKPRESLQQPALFTNVGVDDSCTHWHTALKSFVSPDMTLILALKKEVIEKLIAAERSHAIATAAATTVFEWNPSGASEPLLFNISKPDDPYKKHVVMVFENGKFDMTEQGMPFAGLSMFVSCVAGFVSVSVAPHELVQSGGADFNTFLQSSDALLLEKVPTFLLKQGESCQEVENRS